MPIGKLLPRKCKKCGRIVFVAVGDILGEEDWFQFTCDKCKRGQ